MSAHESEVDPEVLWHSARTITTTADLAETHLKSSDAAVASCGRGWSTMASAGFDEFVDRSDRFTRDLLQKLADLEQSTRLQPHSTNAPTPPVVGRSPRPLEIPVF